MAKQVSEILVKLGIQGAEGLDKLKSSFRELERSIGPSAATIERARESIIAYGKEGKNSEQVIKGQIEALRGLQSQAERGSSVWSQLAGDIERFRQASRRTDAEINVLRESILSVAAGSNQSQQSLRSYIADLGRLRNEATITGVVFNTLGSDIAELTSKLQQVETQTVQTSRAFGRVLGQVLASTSAGARTQLQSLTALIDEQRGLIDNIDSLSQRERRLTHNVEARTDAQERLNRALAQQRQLTYQESARAGRETARSAAAAFADSDFLRTVSPEALDKRLGELPNTTAGLNQGLSELSERLANTARNTTDYLVVAMQMAGVQRELTAVTQGYAQSLLMGIRTGTVAPSARNLQEVIAALRAEMAQLDTTTTEGARAYAENANQARNLEVRLRELGNSYRHVADMATQAATAQASEATARVTANYLNRGLVRAQQEALAELGQRVRAGVAATPLALPAAGQTTAPGTGLEISGGARLGGPSGQTQRFFARFDPGDARFGLQAQSYGPAATEEQSDRARRAAISEADAVRTAGEARARAEQQVQSYRAEIDKARRADIGSIESTQRLRDAINQYRSTLPGASAEFRKLTKELGDLDVRSEKLSRNLGRRRMTGMEMGQAAGAALSGGIFGGPEGFLGGAVGGVFGGVGGAFAGAAAGAQVGMLRQQLGGFADYAAQIQKMQIALRDAAGSQDQFNQAVEAANFAVRNLNVPQDVAIQGMTKLTAAVRGAGGQVTDAELVFKNVTAAIKATGGSAQDVDGAITAMVQVFSKGKVSAEELSGQLGERLPGAVTKFAQANEMTLPELSKALEQGQVGLNELMNFIVQLGDEYSGAANQIADSSQDAGARLTVAFNDMRIAIGETLQPVGAQFQEAFADFIVNITPGLVAAAKAVGDGIKFIINNASQIGAVVEFAAKLAGVTLALKALQAMQGPIGTLFVALQSGFTATTAQAAAAQTRIIAFGTAVKTVAASLVAPLVITVLISGAQVVISWLNKVKEAQDRVKKAATAARGESWVQEIGGSAADYATLKNQVQAAGDTYQYLADKIKAARQEMASTPFKPRREFLAQQIAADEAQMAVAQSRYRAGITALGGRQPTRPALTQFPDIAGDGGQGKADKEAEKAAREAQRLYEENLRNAMRLQDVGLRTLQLEELTTLERERQQLVNRDADRIEFAILDLKQKQLGLDIRQTHLNEVNERLEDLRVQGLRQGLDVSKTAEEISRNKIEYLELQLEAEKNITDQLELQRQIIEATGLTREMRQAGRRAAIGVFDYGQAGAANFAGGEQIYQPQEFMTPEAQRFQEMRQQLEEMVSLQNQVQAGAMQMGEAFSSAFIETITGSKSAKQALADLMASIGKHFLDMAQQIITQQIAMILYGTIMKALGVGLSGGGAAPNYSGVFSSGQAGFNPSVFTGPSLLPAANGAAFAQNGIQPFAMGGIVTKPTFFKYAKGGEMQNGIMGEAGPEAIMPLKRGPDGKLGVAAQLDGRSIPVKMKQRDEALGRYRPIGAMGTMAADSEAAMSGGSAAGGVAAIDVRYSVERINNVEYVTAEQFRAGMQQAAAQGAQKGQQLTLRRLQQSPATRRKVGI